MEALERNDSKLNLAIPLKKCSDKEIKAKNMAYSLVEYLYVQIGGLFPVGALAAPILGTLGGAVIKKLFGGKRRRRRRWYV